MAITTMDQLLNGLSVGRRINFLKVSIGAEGVGTFQSLWKATGNPTAGANPATVNGEFPTFTTVGTLDFTNPAGANTKYIGRINMQSSTAGTLVLYDRLWANSGLVGNVTTAQTFASGTPTRYSDGIGVEIFGEVYTAMGATGSVFSVTYVDSTDATRVGTYTQPANALSVGQMFPINPPAGALGCKSISQVQLGTSTGTAGSFGLVMLRRIADIPMPIVNIATLADAFALGLPELKPSAALATMVACTTTNTGNIFGTIDIIEG